MEYRASVLCRYQWTMNIDLREDLKNRTYSGLIAAGYKDADRKHAVFQHFNLIKRKIAPRSRKVFYSKEFTYPKEYEKALKEFEAKILSGADLTPFQSEKVKLSSYNDMLLNDWGIQHFHLSRRFRDDGFVARSKYQIFAYVTDDSFYMIQVYPHKDDDIYYRKELVAILKDNWPKLIEPYHIIGISGLSETIDDQQYRQLRDANALTFIEFGKNEVYGMIGGGYASNGYSAEAIRNSDYWMNRMGIFQELFVDNAEQIGKLLSQQSKDSVNVRKMNIKLLWIDSAEKITTLEINSGLAIQVDIKEGRISMCELQALSLPGSLRESIT